MKIRFGFVSNSSSSSFILSKSKMTKKQIRSIINHMDVWWLIKDRDVKNKIYTCYERKGWDAWTVEEKDDKLKVSTHMDNFSMHDFFKYIGLRMDAIIEEGD